MQSDRTNDRIPSTGPHRRPSRASLLRWPAFAWALAFAFMHGHWLLGGRTALPADISITPGSALFYSALVAVPLLLAAGAVALIGGRTGVAITPRQATWLLGGVAGFCLLHATPPLIHAGWTLSTAGELAVTERGFYALLYEFNWLMGGAYFSLALLAVRREQMSGHRVGAS